MCLVNRRGLGKAEHVDMQNLWIQEAFKSKRFVMKKVGTKANPADLMTKALPGPEVVQVMKIMGYDFVGQHSGSTRVTLHETGDLTATCRMKFNRGVLAVGCGAASVKDNWIV